MYEDCIAYDPARVDCVAFLGRLHLDSENNSSPIRFSMPLGCLSTHTVGRPRERGGIFGIAA